jgi:UDP-glucose 4-epimerase
MKILLIGGSGFIGSHALQKFSENKWDISVFDRSIDKEIQSKYSINFYQGDFQDGQALERAISQGCDVLLHLVSTTTPGSSNDAPSFDVSSNLLGSISIFELCVKYSIPKLIFISSGGAVYGNPIHVPIGEEHPTNPISSYGIVKLAIEKYLEFFKHSYGLNYTALRLSNPYGSGQNPNSSQGAVAVFANKILLGNEIVIWGDGSVVRDFIAIEDVSELIFSVADSPNSGGVFNVGSGVGSSISEIISLIKNSLGIEAKLKFLPSRPFDPPKVILNPQKVMDRFFWSPKISIQDGIDKYCKSLKFFK